MSDEAERWLTYAEAGDLLGISPEAARQLARRRKWPRRTPNEHGAAARILVPSEQGERGTVRPVERLRPAVNGVHTGDDRGTEKVVPLRLERPVAPPDSAEFVRRTVELMMGPIREQLDHERSRADRADKRADDLKAKLDEARAELDARKQWGLWRRVRGR